MFVLIRQFNWIKLDENNRITEVPQKKTESPDEQLMINMISSSDIYYLNFSGTRGYYPNIYKKGYDYFIVQRNVWNFGTNTVKNSEWKFYLPQTSPYK